MKFCEIFLRFYVDWYIFSIFNQSLKNKRMKSLLSAILKLSSVVVVVTFFISSCTEQSFIDDPKVGDVYQIERRNVVPESEISYQLVKVRELKGDSLLLMPNRMYYHEKVYCIAAGDYFNTKASYYSTKQDIEKMFADGDIVEVFRLYEKSCLGHDK